MSESTGPWTLIVYRDGTPEDHPFPTEEEAREFAAGLERDGWVNGIPDTLAAPDGSTAWHRPHDAAG